MLLKNSLRKRILGIAEAEAALARLEHPEATLKELGESLNPPVGKSGINHRLRKLSEMADKVRQEQGGLL